MLVLTEAAAEVVKAISSTPQAPEGSGLRIASPAGSDPGALQVTAGGESSMRSTKSPGAPSAEANSNDASDPIANKPIRNTTGASG